MTFDFGGALGGVNDWRSRNRNMLLGLGGGLLSGDLGNAPLYAAEGRKADDAYATQQKAEADRVAQINQTAQWARTQFPELISAPDELVAQMAPKLWESQLTGGSSNVPANIQEWEYFSKLPPAEQSQYLTMKRSVPYLDLGPEYARPDPVTGQPTRTMTKDNFTPAYDAASGTAQGKVDVEVGAEASSLASKLPGLKSVVGELSQLAEKATYTVTGQVIDSAMREAGLEPTEAAVARTKYIAMVDNQVLPLLRDTFGAAFTVKEGETLRATLGDPNKGPTEKQAILEAFIEQKVRDLAALQSRVPAASGGASSDPLGIR
jgi:hypothetical protein